MHILDSIGEDERGSLAIGLMGVEEADRVLGQEGALPDPEGMGYDGAESHSPINAFRGSRSG
jgi:hypothetical protein